VRWSFGIAGRPTEMSAASVQMLARRGTYSIAAAGARLGYAPRVTVAEGMRRTQLWLERSGYL
jgi:nucleoside-diphosphate-sugar epimerase